MIYSRQLGRSFSPFLSASELGKDLLKWPFITFSSYKSIIDYLGFTSSDTDYGPRRLEVSLRAVTSHSGPVPTIRPFLEGLPAQKDCCHSIEVFTLRSLLIVREETELKCFHLSQTHFP